MPPVPPSRRQRTQRVASLHNGVSSQPPTAMLPNQVASALNASFSVVDGMTRRPGSDVQQHLADGLLPAANNRVHDIVRDGDEKHIVVHNRTGAGTVLRVLELATNRWATVSIDAEAQNYLDTASPDEFRFRTLLDHTLIVNTEATLGAIEMEGDITSISAASPAVVTSTAHGLVTGDKVWVEDSDSTPVIDGEHTVTVTGADTFTVPVAVTAPGTTGSWSRYLPDPETMPVKLVRQNTGDSGTITANSAANPTVITSAAHGLVSGQSVTITGSNSTPSIDGTHVVTVLSANTFSIPVDVSAGVAGTAGTWTSQGHFTVELVDWDIRRSGDETTNPFHALWSEGRTLSDLRYWRGRLWFLGDEFAVSSQAGDLFNVWIEDVDALGDADPIRAQVSSDQVTVIDYALPVRDSLMLFTESGQQFELSAADALTPASVKIKPLTTYRILPCEPVVLDPALYFVADAGCAVHLLEYIYDEVALPSRATDVSAHAADLIPLGVDVPAVIGVYDAEHGEARRIRVSVEHGVVFVLRRDKVVDGENFATKLFLYRAHYLGANKVQSAWTVWEFARNGETKGIRGIHDFCVIGNYVYLLVHCGTDSPPDFFLVRVSIVPETDCETYPSPSTQS
jgi:hypothetical protein